MPRNLTTLTAPCHDAAAVGGPVRVWCSACGRSYQADDPQLGTTGPLSRTSTFAEVTRSDYATPRGASDEA